MSITQQKSHQSRLKPPSIAGMHFVIMALLWHLQWRRLAGRVTGDRRRSPPTAIDRGYH